jgi:hypothetical protein
MFFYFDARQSTILRIFDNTYLISQKILNETLSRLQSQNSNLKNTKLSSRLRRPRVACVSKNATNSTIAEELEPLVSQSFGLLNQSDP